MQGSVLMSRTSKAKRLFKHSYVRTVRVIALIASLCAGGLTLAGGFSKAGDAEERMPSIRRGPVRPSSYAMGDKLNPAVFERIRPELPSHNTPGNLVSSAVEKS